MAGKGDTPRPVDRAKYDEGYDRIFRKPVKVEVLVKEPKESEKQEEEKG
jgi:hypothetical protein